MRRVNCATCYGSTIPLSKTKQERESNGDRRLSLEERYPSEHAYQEQLKQAVNQLVSDRFLLKQDGDKILAEGKLSL